MLIKESVEVTKNFTNIFGSIIENCIFCSTETLYWDTDNNTPICKSCYNKYIKKVKRQLPLI